MTSWATYRDAISEGLRIEMRRDRRIVCVEPGVSAGARAIAKMLEPEFGAERILRPGPDDRAPAEIARALLAEGARVVLTASTDQWRSVMDDLGPKADLVLRAVGGRTSLAVRYRGVRATFGAAKTATSSLVPMLAPATPADAKGMIAYALNQDGPTCFVEREDLYGAVDAVPEGRYVVEEIGARVDLAGDAMSIVASGAALAVAHRAAEELNAGIEVVDLRTLRPLDAPLIASSVAKSGKALILERSPEPFDVGAAVVELIEERAHDALDAPVWRLTLPPMPPAVGTARKLCLADLDRVKDTCRELLAF